MIEYEKEIGEIKTIVEKLYKQSKSKGVLLVDEKGQQIIFHCEEDYLCGKEFHDLLLNELTADWTDGEMLKVGNDVAHFYGYDYKIKIVFLDRYSSHLILSVSTIFAALEEITEKINYIFSDIRQKTQTQ
jgi:hypothetical protein